MTVDIAKPSATTPPAATPSAASEPASGGIPSLDSITKRTQLLQQINAVGPKYGVAMATSMMALDKHDLELRKQTMENQLKSIEKTTEMFAGVTDQTGYDEARRLAGTLGAREVAQLPPDVNDPRAQAWLAYKRASAQTQQQRVQDELKKADQAIALYGHHTARMTEERMRGKQTPVQTAAGNIVAFPEFGAPGGTTQTGVPVQPLTQGGQPVRSIESQRMQNEQEQAQSTAFREETKPFQIVRDAYNQVQTASKVNPKNPAASDTALLEGFESMLKTGSRTLKPEELTSWWQQLQKFWESFTKSQALLPQQRKALLDQAAKIYLAAEQVYDQQLSTARERASGTPGVRPHIVAQDIRANTRPYTAADVAAGVAELNADGKRQVTPAQYEQYLRLKGRRKGD
jgi:hypothetical protein